MFHPILGYGADGRMRYASVLPSVSRPWKERGTHLGYLCSDRFHTGRQAASGTHYPERAEVAFVSLRT